MLGPVEIFMIILIMAIYFVLPIAIIIIIYRYFKGRHIEKLQDMIIALIRKRGEASIDDIILNVKVSKREAIKVLNKLAHKGVITETERDGVQYYIMR